MEQKNEKSYEEISKKFEEFCHTKGIAAKFKVAFADMAESAAKQKEIDKENFEKVKQESIENNAEFVELLHTKGFKPKIKLIIQNMKKSAKEAPKKCAQSIDQVLQKTNAKIKSHSCKTIDKKYTTEELSIEFNEFLKSQGLDKKYTVEIVENK